MQLAEVAVKWLKFEEVKKAVSLLLITDCLVVCIACLSQVCCVSRILT